MRTLNSIISRNVKLFSLNENCLSALRGGGTFAFAPPLLFWNFCDMPANRSKFVSDSTGPCCRRPRAASYQHSILDK